MIIGRVKRFIDSTFYLLFPSQPICDSLLQSLSKRISVHPNSFAYRALFKNISPFAQMPRQMSLSKTVYCIIINNIFYVVVYELSSVFDIFIIIFSIFGKKDFRFEIKNSVTNRRKS